MREFAADIAVATDGSRGFSEIGEEHLLAAELGLVGVLEHSLKLGDEALLPFLKDRGR